MSTLLHACSLEYARILTENQQDPDQQNPEAAMALLEERARKGGQNSASESEGTQEDDWRQK